MQKHKSYHRTIMTKHTLAMMLGTTSSTNGSNTGANLGERDAPRFLICVRRSSYGERNVEVCPGEEQAGDEAGARDQRREDAHEGAAAACGGTPCAGG